MRVSRAESSEADNDAVVPETCRIQIRKAIAFHLRLLAEVAVSKPHVLGSWGFKSLLSASPSN
jgi:hypothetical protein